MIKEFKLKKKELELGKEELIKLKIAELEKENEKLKGKKESIPKEPIPERHMEAIKELIKNQAARGVKEESVHTNIRTYRKDYDLPREKFLNFTNAIFEQIYKENFKKKPPKPSPTPSPEKSPAAEAEAGAEAGAEV